MNNNPFNDMDMFKFLKGFQVNENKDYITKLYIEGRINKDEFIKRMKKANVQTNS